MEKKRRRKEQKKEESFLSTWMLVSNDAYQTFARTSVTVHTTAAMRCDRSHHSGNAVQNILNPSYGMSTWIQKAHSRESLEESDTSQGVEIGR